MREYYLPWLVMEDLGPGEIVVARFAAESLANDFVEHRATVSYAKYNIRHEQSLEPGEI